MTNVLWRLFFRKRKFDSDNDKHVTNLIYLEDWAEQVRKMIEDHEARITTLEP